MLASSLTPRPTQLEADPTAAWIFMGANVVASAIAITAAIVYAYRHREVLAMYFIAAGALAWIATEPILDHLLLVWYPTNSPWVIAHFFNIGMPAYLLMGYPWYVGLGAFVVHRALQGGITARTLWQGYAVVALLDVLIELPSTAAGVHIYYGQQPNFFENGLSVTIPFVMSAVSLLAGFAAHIVLTHLSGWRSTIGILIAVPSASVATLVGTQWPLMVAQNSGASALVVWMTAFIAIIITLSVTWFAITCMCSRTTSTSATDSRSSLTPA